MKNAIILHGTCSYHEYFADHIPSLSNNHWFPWLQKQLLIKGIHAVTPEVPDAYKLDYDLWRREVECFDIGPETILVGHSCGAGFWVRWLSDHPKVKVDKVVLVAPWIDPTNSKQSDFFEFKINPNIALQTAGITVFESDNDMETVQESIKILRGSTKGIKYREFKGYGHFTILDMKTEEFPEILQTITAN